jgi:hypothetical protein
MSPHRHLIAAAMVLCCCRPASAETIPAPVAMPDNTFLVVYIPDLLAALDRLEQTAIAINPDTPKGVMRMGLGGTLGDPELAQFGKGPVAIAIAPGTPTPSIAFILPSSQPQAYIDAVGNAGVMGKAVGSNVILSKLPDGLDLGERLIPKLKAIASVPIQGDARILVGLDKVMSAYGPFLSQMSMMAGAMGGAQPGQAAAAKLLPLYVAALQAVATDVEVMQLDLRFNPEAIVSTLITSAKAGSPLAKALVAAPAGPLTAETRLGEGKGLVLTSGRLNYTAMGEYAKQVASQLQARPEAKDIITKEVIELIGGLAGAYTGDFAMRMNVGDGKGSAFTSHYVVGTLDAARAMDLALKGFAMTSGDSFLGKMYSDMGITMKVVRDVRAIGATKVQKVTVTMDPAKIPDGQAEAMKRMMPESEFAMANGFMFLAQGTPIDALLSGGGKAPKLAARKVFGPGRSLYTDLNLAGFALMVTQMMPMPSSPGMQEALKKMSPDNPVTSAATVDGGRFRAEVHIPTKPIAEISKAIQSEFSRHPSSDDFQEQDSKPKGKKDDSSLY